jgi:ribose transport system substrate-binding protein
MITLIPGSATALDDAIAAAHEKGIPFITTAGSVTSAYPINVDSSYTRWAYNMITTITKEKPNASVPMVKGITGHPIAIQQKQGVDQALANNPVLRIYSRSGRDS